MHGQGEPYLGTGHLLVALQQLHWGNVDEDTMKKGNRSVEGEGTVERVYEGMGRWRGFMRVWDGEESI